MDAGGQSGRRPARNEPGRTANRAESEAALEQAALALLARDGVLAGLNLREAADLAGVNRGLVYHYYGSRGRLLRRAIKRTGERSLNQLRRLTTRQGLQRWRRVFEILLRDPTPVELTTLLLLDGTEPLRVAPLLDQAMASLRLDVEAGELAPDVDLVALHAVLVTSIYGYLLYRRALAAEHGLPVRQLDRRVADLLYDRLLPHLRDPIRGAWSPEARTPPEDCRAV